MPFALTRFAPAPTGYLHLGHVLNAHYVWTLARQQGARVSLRVEDHDRERCRPEYETALLDDLDWLGFTPDLFTTAEFRAGSCESRQSDRRHIYESVAQSLVARGLVYACSCSRADIDPRVLRPGAPISLLQPRVSMEPRAFRPGGGEPVYPGTCRDRGLTLGAGVSWRLRMDAGVESFDDLLVGSQRQDPSSQCGDVVIRDRLGNWTYQFVVSVDDCLQGIDLVVRGEDLLASTGRQIRIARLIGRETPAVFAHHGLLMKSPTQKLSKSDNDTGVRDLRAAGLSREDVISRALSAESYSPTGPQP